MLDGHLCGCMALKDKSYCHYHQRYYHPNARPTEPDYELPIFEDTRSLLLGLREIVYAYMHRQIDQKQATTLLYAYQIAMSGVHRPDGMSPHALDLHEARELALATIKKRSSSSTTKEEQKQAEEDRLADEERAWKQHLAEGLTGHPIDWECKHLPPDQRPSTTQILFKTLDTATGRTQSSNVNSSDTDPTGG